MKENVLSACEYSPGIQVMSGFVLLLPDLIAANILEKSRFDGDFMVKGLLRWALRTLNFFLTTKNTKVHEKEFLLMAFLCGYVPTWRQLQHVRKRSKKQAYFIQSAFNDKA